MNPCPGVMSSGRISPGSFGANASRPWPPTAVYSVMNSVPPANARPSAPMNPPCCPPTDVPVCIWIAIDIQDSSPDSAKTFSFASMLSSSTGNTVPTIFASMSVPSSSVAVVRIDDAAPGRRPRGIPGAIVADADDQDLSAHGLEPVAALQVRLEVVHDLLLDVHHATADLAHSAVMVAARELVVRRPLAEVGGVYRAGGRQRLDRAVHGAARKAGLGPMQLVGQLLRGAVPAQAHDRVVHHLALCGAPHSGREHQRTRTRRRSRGGRNRRRRVRGSTARGAEARSSGLTARGEGRPSHRRALRSRLRWPSRPPSPSGRASAPTSPSSPPRL